MRDELEKFYRRLPREKTFIFNSKQERIKFNSKMIILNELESLGKVKLNLIENNLKNEFKVIVTKIKK
ncbi:hypothetical protein [Fusobacterium mortiferum]|uniref:Uncharacterized protein n=1 Tax=Fusobacterium mortiferum TaxID=850 RepID=A0ABS2G3H1_FUSMR|nr:hypothetical protein [Fusobacterium mortiferum]MBM6875138.1 hypothetical protein [Fusobacterium mortiferum]